MAGFLPGAAVPARTSAAFGRKTARLRPVATLKVPRGEELGGRASSPGALLDAARPGEADRIQALLREGADASARLSASGETALMLAALRGHLEVVRVLVGARADVNAQDYCRRTGLACPPSSAERRQVAGAGEPDAQRSSQTLRKGAMCISGATDIGERSRPRTQGFWRSRLVYQ